MNRKRLKGLARRVRGMIHRKATFSERPTVSIPRDRDLEFFNMRYVAAQLDSGPTCGCLAGVSCDMYGGQFRRNQRFERTIDEAKAVLGLTTQQAEALFCPQHGQREGILLDTITPVRAAAAVDQLVELDVLGMSNAPTLDELEDRIWRGIA